MMHDAKMVRFGESPTRVSLENGVFQRGGNGLSWRGGSLFCIRVRFGCNAGRTLMCDNGGLVENQKWVLNRWNAGQK